MKNTDNTLESEKFNELVGKLTHELNTPITIIKANLEVLQMTLQSQCKKEVSPEISAMQDQIERLEYIVATFKQLQLQKKEVSKDKINLYHTINNSLEMVHKKYKAYQLQIFIETNGKKISDFTIYADAKKLELVCFKLLCNAVDAYIKNDIAQKTIQIALFITDKELCIYINDKAGGIEAKVLKNLFKPFVSTKMHNGLGLSMYLVKEILEQEGFSIDISSDKSNTAVKIVKALI